MWPWVCSDGDIKCTGIVYIIVKPFLRCLTLCVHEMLDSNTRVVYSDSCYVV